jgi:hypothetical protein
MWSAFASSRPGPNWGLGAPGTSNRPTCRDLGNLGFRFADYVVADGGLRPGSVYA